MRTAACGAPEAGPCEVLDGRAYHQGVKGTSCDSQLDCTYGLRCDGTTCTDRLPKDAECPSSFACQSGLSCQSGACQPVTEGVTSCHDDEACSDVRDEAFLALEQTNSYRLRCDPQAAKCRAVTYTGQAGQPCSVRAFCAPGFYCKGLNELGSTPVCAASLKYGDACTTNDWDCSRCDDGICTDPIEGYCKK